MSAQDQLLTEIAAYCVSAGVAEAETTFGRLAVNDGKFVARLRAGGSLTMATYERVRAYLSANAPAPEQAA